MDELYSEFFAAIDSMRKIRIGELFPDMTQGDGATLLAIEHLNKKKKEKEGVTVSDLAERTRTKPSAVSRTLKTLEERGLVERTINRSDRRNTYVTLTETGSITCKQFQQTMCEFGKAVIDRMDEADMRRMIAYINKLNQVAREELEIRKADKCNNKG